MAETMVRVSITVPRELKAEMDRHAAKENWSALAVDAFRVRVKYHDEREKAMRKIEQAAVRLRALDAQERNEHHAAGLATGRRWAIDIASPTQLRRLAKATGEGDPSDVVALGFTEGNVKGLSDILQGYTDEGTDPKSFWTEFMSSDELASLDENDYAIGFVEGALEVWEAVQKKW